MTDSIQAVEEALQHLINRGQIEVPMLPEVASKAVILAQNPNSDASEMAQLIQSDQSLAGHVMRIANSAAYTPLSNLVSLQQAIARLGMQTISEIALSAAVGAKLFNTPGYESYVAGIWQHALATSLWSKEIARQCRSNVEVAFLAGLLHSIGRPAVLQAIIELGIQLNISLDDVAVHQLENKYCHQVSLAVVNTWNMPRLVVEAMTDFTESRTSLTVENHAAQIIAGAMFASNMLDPDQFDREMLLSLPVLEMLNLYQDEVEGLLAKTEAVTAKLEGLTS